MTAVFIMLTIIDVHADRSGGTKKCTADCTFLRPACTKECIKGNNSNHHMIDVGEGYQINNNSQNNEWDIRKKLAKNDVKSYYLYIPGEPFNQKILHKMPQGHQHILTSFQLLRIIVLDVNTGDKFVMLLKRFKAGYSLSDNWPSRFVQRRKLKVNDEIGLRWTNLRIHFTKFG
ncbi:uncharacterized protein LOC130782187 [Actinidia eriantha]|uniref:uncharacterized protein LOC130782187 n=1 Tax=Actinidia eriantha TaxID=165200 RepID=UPI00258A494A|nr:uncharacterized protein LOC130782187 [Actinidia eriantha]